MSWKIESEKNHVDFVALANQKQKLLTHDEITNFLVLAISGEAGELANLIKKKWRGDVLGEDYSQKVASEVADIRIYLHHLSKHLGIDLDLECQAKASEVANRLVQNAVNSKGA